MRTVHVLAEGQGRSGVDGVLDGEWVVTLGQHLLHEQLQATGSDVATARVRTTSWQWVLELQGLQREDLLEEFLTKQRRIAGVLGAELPSDPEVVEDVLAGGRADAGAKTQPGER